ncbi:MAG: hypothetical protein O3A25_12040 [Acidobacteria bacterium]|nr:hypothetical protein [Acidobacteriota bacterium]
MKRSTALLILVGSAVASWTAPVLDPQRGVTEAPRYQNGDDLGFD